MSSAVVKSEVGHVLHSITVEPNPTWHVFKELWQSARFLCQFLGLLHGIWETAEPETIDGERLPKDKNVAENARVRKAFLAEEKVEKVLFLFSLADGWNGPSACFAAPSDPVVRKYSWNPESVQSPYEENRKKVAEKALGMLLPFFKDTLQAHQRNSDGPSWICEPRILEKAIWFLRDRTNLQGSSDHKAELLGKFAVTVVRFAWHYDPIVWELNVYGQPERLSHKALQFREENEPMRLVRQRILAARPILIDALSATSSLDILTDQWFWVRVDEDSLNHLETIALRGRHNSVVAAAADTHSSHTETTKAARCLLLLRQFFSQWKKEEDERERRARQWELKERLKEQSKKQRRIVLPLPD